MSGDCGGNCSACGGCARELVLTPGEVDVLNSLGQIPFLPIARRADAMEPVYWEQGEKRSGEYSLILQCLEKKGLISLDYDRPLGGFASEAYEAYPVRGSMALTARGQQVLEMIEIQGIRPEA